MHAVGNCPILVYRLEASCYWCYRSACLFYGFLLCFGYTVLMWSNSTNTPSARTCTSTTEVLKNTALKKTSQQLKEPQKTKHKTESKGPDKWKPAGAKSIRNHYHNFLVVSSTSCFWQGQPGCRTSEAHWGFLGAFSLYISMEYFALTLADFWHPPAGCNAATGSTCWSKGQHPPLLAHHQDGTLSK